MKIKNCLFILTVAIQSIGLPVMAHATTVSDVDIPQLQQDIKDLKNFQRYWDINSTQEADEVRRKIYLKFESIANRLEEIEHSQPTLYQKLYDEFQKSLESCYDYKINIYGTEASYEIMYIAYYFLRGGFPR